MPAHASFLGRIEERLDDIAEEFGTPFHLYDEAGIAAGCAELNRAFTGIRFRQHFAVKALPNPAVIAPMVRDHGFGCDCSSLPELAIAEIAGVTGDAIMFTSNNTAPEELQAAVDLNATLTIDDLAIAERLPDQPGTVLFRWNPGVAGVEDPWLGQPAKAKFGLRTDQLPAAMHLARAQGAKTIGLHAMLASNELTPQRHLATLDRLLGLALDLERMTKIPIDVFNLGGGVGIPYHLGEEPFDVPALADGVRERFARHADHTGRPAPALALELGRWVTGPHGILVTRVLHRLSKWRELVGVDASMSALMRPALYNAHHEITVHGGADRRRVTVDIVGPLCEDFDRFATERSVPDCAEGDLILIHDTGAHGAAMGFQYNGRLRPQELLLRSDGRIERIRRAETIADYLATLVTSSPALPTSSAT
jgi:diaminopimelate decarboxylase